MPKEIATFVEYDKEGNEVMARFYDRAMQEEFSLTKEECEKRLEDALRKGYLHDQTFAALRGWPQK